MYTLYGFIKIPVFNSNVPKQTAALGELSTYCQTYSTEIGSYKRNEYRDVGLASIDSRRDGALVEVGVDYYSLCLQMSQWMYDRTVAGLITLDPAALMQALTAEFGDLVEIKDVGKIVTYKHYNLPSRINISFKGAGEENDLYLWYANDYFEIEYPRHETKVILPHTPIDDLIGSRESAMAILAAINEETHNLEVQKTIGDQPQTVLFTKMFNWTDKDNDEITRPAPFSCIIHGIAGNNIDIIKDAIREEILKNSEHGEAEWAKVFPELFTPTEFYLVPLWDRYSLPNQVLSTGTYSPTVPQADILAYANKYFKGYAVDHIAANCCLSGSIFKSALFVSCGHPRNYKAETRFDLEWPKYCAVPTSSPEFNNLPPKTQKFVMKMVELFKAAEEATENSIVPTGMTRVLRDGVNYLTVSLDNIQYICPIKKNFAKV